MPGERTRITIPQAVNQIQRNSSISNVDRLRPPFFNRADLNSLVAKKGFKGLANVFGTLVQAQRLAQYYPFRENFPQLQFPNQAEIYKYLPKGSLDGRVNAPLVSFEYGLARVVDDSSKRNQLVQLIDDTVQESSRDNLQKLKRNRRIKKDFVVVGGGLTTPVATGLLGVPYEVTVVSADKKLGGKWPDRRFYINSTVERTQPNGQRLPLLGGGTTPIGPIEFGNRFEAGLFIDDALTVVCQDGKKRNYIEGRLLGQLSAINTFSDVEDYIMGQNVRLIANSRNATNIVLDNGDVIEANYALVLSGPGKEQTSITDEGTKFTYNRSVEKIDSLVKRAVDRQGVFGLLFGRDFSLPTRLLTLSTFEKLYSLWDTIYQDDPKYFPFREVINQGRDLKRQKIAFIGFGDSARVGAEIIRGLGPNSAYPPDLDRKNVPDIVFYAEGISSTQEALNFLRPRYGQTGLFEQNQQGVDFIPRKVTRYREKTSDGKPFGIEVTDSSGKTQLYDWVFDATGLQPTPIPIEPTPRKIQDFEGNTVGLGNERVFVGGSATGFRAPDFPPQIRTIIESIGIPENTISLWVNALLVERLIWTLLGTLRVNEQKFASLLDNFYG